MTANVATSRTVASAQDLLSLSQAELDELYEKSPVGEIPTGDTRGTAIVKPTWFGKLAAPLARLLFWQGKVFNPAQGDLKNKVSPFGVKSIRAKVYVGESWKVKGQQAIIIDYSDTSFVAKKIRDEIRQIGPGLYLGKVFWGRTHILDFSLSLDK